MVDCLRNRSYSEDFIRAHAQHFVPIVNIFPGLRKQLRGLSDVAFTNSWNATSVLSDDPR